MEAWSADGCWLWFTSSRSARGTGLYQVPLCGGTPFPLIEEPYESFYNVALSPDGEHMAVTNNGDAWWRRGPNPHGASQIWVGRLGAPGEPLRDLGKVIDAPCRNTWPMWSADGRGLFFVSDRGGCENIWHQPLAGGSAEQVTRFAEGRLVRPSISGDGCEMVFEHEFGLWTADASSGAVRELEIRLHPSESVTPASHWRQADHLADLALSPDGRKVLFVAHGKVFADFADKSERPRNDSFPVSDTQARERLPTWHPNSNSAVYVSDRDGENALYRYDFVAREERRLTDPLAPASAPRYSPDGKWIAFYRHPNEIRLLETATGSERDFIRAPFPFVGTDHPSFCWSPDSRWIAFSGRDARFFANAYVQRIDETEARPVSFLSNTQLEDLIWSPDGRFLVFTTRHHRVESQVARVELRPLERRFAEEEFAGLFQAPKPAEPEPEPPTEPVAAGTGEPPEEPAPPEESAPAEPAVKPAEVKPVEVVFDGIRERLRFLTPISLHCSARAISPDAKQLVYVAQINGKPNLWSRSLEEERRDEPAMQLTATTGGKEEVWFAPDGKKIHYLDDGRIGWRPFPRGDTKGLDVVAAFDVDFHREKRHVFREAWSLIRDHFYDPAYHGADWAAQFHRFWPFILGARRPEELQELLNLMVGELRASHLGAYSSDDAPADGYLGLLFDPAELAATGALRIREVLADGPTAVVAEPARVGEYLVAIDGLSVGGETEVWTRVRRRVGKRVFLSLNDRPDEERARQIAVQPIGAGEHDRLRYREWVRGNREYVDLRSGGRLGYAHVRAMSFDCYTQLLQDLDTENHSREGVVVDVRFNGGGYVAPFILDLLQRRSYDRSVFRDSLVTSSINLAGARILDRPTIILTNEHSGSNTEMFSEGYRALGLGEVVGRPTAGAVIWTWEWTLLDGSRFRLPRLRVETLSGENLEGRARPVDYDVEQPIGEWRPDPSQRRDRQLDVAVERLLARIDGEGG
jgi:Tol biopolymer transport system component/C-terminal processing protease CtpA/Prc